MIIDKQTFGTKLKGLFSQARENLQKKENGQNDYSFTRKDFGFYIDDKIIVKLGLGQFGAPAFVPWMGFIGPQQKPQEGIYPVILCYLKQHTIIVTYGISATRKPEKNWNNIIDKNGHSPQTIGAYFKSIEVEVENPDYNNCYVYSIYSDALTDTDISDIYDDVNVLLDIYRNTLGISPSIKDPLRVLSPNKSHINHNLHDFSINSITDSILSTSLIYSPILIKRLAFSLMAKPFVILSGLAGSGKTQLALAFAKCLSENIEEQVCTVSIGADWTNREPLLGYPNALNKDEYVKPESGVLNLLIAANREENANKPYFLILDEMNLSVVERYFADFLSAMESGEPIKLWDNENGNVPKEVELPKNVFIIGTINVDETTYMFSPKVLDRANVIEFKIAADEMEDYLGKKVNINLEQAYSACTDMAVDFVTKAKSQVEKDEKNKDVLLSFFKELKEVNAEFGYRTVNEISRYLHFNDDDENGIKGDEAIDTAIVQKLLPKLHGSRKKLEPVLKQLWKLCFTGTDRDLIIAKEHVEKARFKESADKIRRMYESAYANGFTSFAEA